MKHLKTYEGLKDWFKKKKTTEVKTTEIVYNNITFRVGDCVKRYSDNQMGRIIAIDDSNIFPFIIADFKSSDYDYSGEYGPNELYKDEETEIGYDAKNYNL
jgi:hypothetical protein